MTDNYEDLDDPIIIQMEKYGIPKDTDDYQVWKDDDGFWTKSEKET